MKIVVVGHRGVGKTSLLKRWKTYSPGFSFYDLDDVIEKSSGKKIQDIFSQNGEKAFRDLERDRFQKLIEYQDSFVIAVGGGFDLDNIPKDIEILWVRRDTDKDGRIFLNRPRLSPELSPIEEYQTRYQEREKKFAEKAHRVYTMPEGLLKEDDSEKEILLNREVPLRAFVTIQENHLHHPAKYQNCFFEIRDDLLTKEQIEKALQLFPHEQVIYSIRKNPQDVPNLNIDWDLKFPLPHKMHTFILSTHEDNVHKAIEVLKPYSDVPSLLKLCPLIETWEELKAGFDWWKKNPKMRSFLPRSKDGRWAWARQALRGYQVINFVREGAGSSLDQPTLWEWISTPSMPKGFGAVLGSPVHHSYSPAYHKNFFLNYRFPFYKVTVEKNEWSQALTFLKELGLVAAAVTSPLKEEAGQLVGQSPLNTLVRTPEGWAGLNTDQLGAETLLKKYQISSMAVWGGGGVLDSLQNVVPTASFYSVRTGQPREGSKEINSPEIVVWAAPSGSLSTVPKDWKPKVIVDLNYRENSEGLLYAQSLSAEYVSGLEMFLRQAEEQQKYWGSLLK